MAGELGRTDADSHVLAYGRRYYTATPTASTPNHLFAQSATSCGQTGAAKSTLKPCTGGRERGPQTRQRFKNGPQLRTNLLRSGSVRKRHDHQQSSPNPGPWLHSTRRSTAEWFNARLCGTNYLFSETTRHQDPSAVSGYPVFADEPAVWRVFRHV